MRLQLRAASSLPLLFAALIISMVIVPRSALAAQANISVNDNFFSNTNVTIQPGDTVAWRNVGSMSHTVTADSGLFDSGTLLPTASYQYTFTTPGVYRYYCKFHGSQGGIGMSGTIVVAQSNAQIRSGPLPQPSYAPGAGMIAPPSLTDQLRAQIQSLLDQITQLQLQYGFAAAPAADTGASSGGACPLISRSLKRGSSGDDVTRLQQFLAQDTSVYPEGLVTGYYGPATEAAVQRWQAKSNIVSSGTPETTGYGVVGPRTIALLALQCSGASGSNPGVSNPVIGFIQVTPFSGPAPLTTSVQATVNTGNSCTGQTYLLDFGDGSASPVPIVVPTGSCQQMAQTIEHVYQYGGNYTVTLSEGVHQATAHVAVSGPVAPGAGNSGSSQTTSVNLPAESFRASPLSGSAPLTVTFSGIVTSNDAGFCGNSACTGMLDFGDGVTVAVPLPTAPGSAQSYKVTHRYASAGAFTATLYQGAGSGRPTVGSAVIVVGGGSGSGASGTGDSVVATPASGPVPLTVNFTGTINASQSCGGGTYTLLFGDGQNIPLLFDASSCTARSFSSVSHQYATAGNYTAQLLRGVPSSGYLAASAAITAGGGGSSGAGSYGIISITPGAGGNPYAASVQLSLPACPSYSLDWGDGTSPLTQAASCATDGTQAGSTPSVSHTYAVGGNFTIILNGGSDRSQVSRASIRIANY